MTVLEFIPYIITLSIMIISIAFIPCWVIFLIGRKINARKYRQSNQKGER